MVSASRKSKTSNYLADFLIHSFCKAKTNGICFKLFSKEEINLTQAQLEKECLGGITVPGARMYHHFIPISLKTISLNTYNY